MTVNLVQTNLSALHIELNNIAGALDSAGNTSEAVSILFDFFTVINRYTRYRRCQMQGKSQNNSGGIYNFKMKYHQSCSDFFLASDIFYILCIDL
jgi:hypothetical protein